MMTYQIKNRYISADTNEWLLLIKDDELRKGAVGITVFRGIGESMMKFRSLLKKETLRSRLRGESAHQVHGGDGGDDGLRRGCSLNPRTPRLKLKEEAEQKILDQREEIKRPFCRLRWTKRWRLRSSCSRTGR